MEKNKKHTNPGLFFFCVLVCGLTGAFITRPVQGPSPMEEAGFSDIFDEGAASLTVVEESDTDAAVASADTVDEAAEAAAEATDGAVEAADGAEAEASAPAEGTTEAASATEAPTEAPTPAEQPKEAVSYEVSPEAADGYWSKAEGSWFFVTDNGNYHGWLHDVDGETYYMNPETGAMTTGLLELDGKTYYFSPDGVLMTGDTEINGMIYHLKDDGSFDEAVQAEAVPTPEVVVTGVPYK